MMGIKKYKVGGVAKAITKKKPKPKKIKTDKSGNTEKELKAYSREMNRQLDPEDRMSAAEVNAQIKKMTNKTLTPSRVKLFKERLKRKSDKLDKQIKEKGDVKYKGLDKSGIKPGDSRPLQKNIKFKKKPDLDDGKENRFDRQVRTKAQDTVRQTGKRRAGVGPVGSDPIVVGRQSMPTMRDINRMNEVELSKLKNKVEQLGKTDPAMKKLSEQIDRIEAQKFSDMNLKGAITRSGKKPDAEGKYLNTETGQEVTLKGSKGISAKERFLPMDYPGAKKSHFIKNPTKGQVEQVERNLAAKKNLKRRGESPEQDVKDAIARKRREQDKKRDKAGRDMGKPLDLKKGLSKAELRKLEMKKGGMARMKKKGMAKGGAMMKKKGMAMGGLKKPAATQSGLKKLPSSVRNKMGYMQKGGMMKKKGMAKGGMKKKGYAMGGMAVKYKVGGMAKGKSYGIVDNRKKK